MWLASDPILGEEPPVLVGEGLLLEQAILQTLEVPHREVVLEAEDDAHAAELTDCLRVPPPTILIKEKRKVA